MGSFKAKLMVVFTDLEMTIQIMGCTNTWIYDFTNLSNKAYIISFTMTNIISRFRKTVVFSFSASVFTDKDIELDFVIDRSIIQPCYTKSTEIKSSNFFFYSYSRNDTSLKLKLPKFIFVVMFDVVRRPYSCFMTFFGIPEVRGEDH